MMELWILKLIITIMDMALQTSIAWKILILVWIKNLGDNFQLKFNLSDFNEIVAGKYRDKIKFQGEKLEFIKGKLEFSWDFEKRKLDFIVDLQLIL